MGSRTDGGRQKFAEKAVDTSDDDSKVTDNQGDCDLVLSLDLNYKGTKTTGAHFKGRQHADQKACMNARVDVSERHDSEYNCREDRKDASGECYQDEKPLSRSKFNFPQENNR